MAIAYILIALLVMVVNIEQLPGVIKLIVRSAFGLEAGYGAIIGMAIQWGVQAWHLLQRSRTGKLSHAAAAAEVSHPVKQGLVQAFLCLC